MKNVNDWRRVGPAAACVVLAALLLAACGGSSDTSSTTETSQENSTVEATETESSNSSGQLAEAEEIVQKASKNPAHVGPTEPLKKPIPSGKTIDLVYCPHPACIEIAERLQEGTDVLGWNLNKIEVEATPQSIQEGFEQAVRDHPDGVAGTGFDKVTFERQLKELDAAGIPVLSTVATDKPGGGIVWQFINPEIQAQYSEALAAKVATDSQCEGGVGSVELTGYPTIVGYTAAFNESIEKFCPNIEVQTLQLADTSLGKEAPSEIANFLRANPDIDSLFLSIDEFAAGLKAAVQATGGELPKLYGKSPSLEGYEALQNGERAASVPGLTPEVSWYWLDMFARLFNNESIDPDKKWQNIVVWSEEAGNLPTNHKAPQIPDYQEQFKELWNK